MIVNSFSELPETCRCRRCGEEKPIAGMVVVRLRKRKVILLRPRCKDCQNAQERGRRREWKRNYLRRWRSRNIGLNEGYWRRYHAENRKHIAALAAARFRRDHAALLIQGRLRRHGCGPVTIKDARRLFKKFGPCYPTRFGLTEEGRRECERIRSRLRASGSYIKPVEIRMMVYADDRKFFIRPRLQQQPYAAAAKSLRAYWRRKKAAAGA